MVSLSLPVHLVEATGTTVEVNSGNAITLDVGWSQSSIPLAMKNFPVLDGATNGLGAFSFILTWDNAVIRVTSVTLVTEPPGYTFLTGAIKPGFTIIGGYASSPPYVSGSLIVAYLTISAVGSPGQSTSINVVIDELTDAAVGNPIPATPVNAPVSIHKLVSIAVTPASSSIGLGQTQQFTATGTYTSGLVVDMTSAVTWSSGNTTVATISPTGLATSLTAGTIAITATLSPINGTAILTVTEAKTEEKEKKEEIVSSAKAEPGITEVAGSDENVVFTEEAPAEFEAGRVEPPVVDEGTTALKAPPALPTNLWLFGAIIAGVLLVGVVIWLALRRRTS